MSHRGIGVDGTGRTRSARLYSTSSLVPETVVCLVVVYDEGPTRYSPFTEGERLGAEGIENGRSYDGSSRQPRIHFVPCRRGGLASVRGSSVGFPPLKERSGD